MLSYSRGPDEPLWEKTIGQVLDQTVERCGDCLAVVSRHQSKRYSWRELRELADCVARGLCSLEIGPGDRVGLWSTNCVEWVMLHLGCARAGAVLVNVNPAYRSHKLAFTLRKSRMNALFLNVGNVFGLNRGSDFAFGSQKFFPRRRSEDNHLLTSLRTGMMAGAPCPVEVMKRVMCEMHCSELTIGYGQTESSPVVTMSAPCDPVEVRVSTIGKALPCTEMKIVSPLDGATVPTGEQGEVCARGYMVMKGYDDEPEATARAVDREGWLHTGDLGVMRDDGHIHLTGRAKDMIIRGGENVYPREVEEFLYRHPKIAEVQVVGIPDERLGELVLAWIRLKTGESATEVEIRRFCEDQIAYFKIPQHVRFVDEFPMTVTGKIQKFKIREIETKERGLERLVNRETA